MAMPKILARKDPTFDQTGPFHTRVGSARPRRVTEQRISEINTQRYAAGSRGGTTSGQGPALESK